MRRCDGISVPHRDRYCSEIWLVGDSYDVDVDLVSSRRIYSDIYIYIYKLQSFNMICYYDNEMRNERDDCDHLFNNIIICLMTHRVV